ncbi:hypothetical protein [Candidatus Poriferisodalis sp.]|uniref:hypothetical protein n=1 Tax=Candidatus Poriferisodalis sp. TaxID=3101277 RepID=UPI003B5BF915
MSTSRLTLPAGLLAGFEIALLAALGIAHRVYWQGGVGVTYVVFALFLSTNLVICYWEICLFFRRDYIESRSAYWQQQRLHTGKSPALTFLTSKVPLRSAFSPTVWADVWASYSVYDGSYADRRTYGFNVDVGNGFITAIPTLILYAAFTTEFLSPLAAGILGIMFFWQWTYATSIYLVSFFIAKRHRDISRREVYGMILALNATWIVVPLLGLYVSIRLVVDGSYGAIGG